MRLRRRRQFLSVARGRKAVVRTLVLQARANGGDCVRLGFTVSRKVGNAVERNRVRRRLREAARDVMPHLAVPGYDYVVVGRRAALGASWARLLGDLEAAFGKLHPAPLGTGTDGG